MSDGSRSPRIRGGRVWRWRFAAVSRITLFAALAAAAVTAGLAWGADGAGTEGPPSGVWALVALAVLSMAAEYVDTSVGMGYGTVVGPVLLMTGTPPETAVAVVLISEAATGLLAAGLHQRAANVDFHRGSRDIGVLAAIAAPAVVAAAATAAVAATLEIGPAQVVIGATALAGGVVALAGKRLRSRYSTAGAVGIGIAAAAAKGLSGAGFGPLATTGQVMIGIPERNAVGVTTAAEGLAAAAGAAVLVAVEGWPDPGLLTAMLAGGVAAVPAGVWTVRLLRPATIRAALGAAACFLGAMVIAGAVRG